MCRFTGEAGNIGGGQAVPQSLITSKEEGSILNDGPSQGKPELVSDKVGSIASLKGIQGVPIEEVPSIQGTVAVKFKQRTVEFIGSRLGGGNDHAAREAPILSRVGAGQNAKFAHRVHPQRNAGNRARRVPPGILGVGPIQKHGVVLGLSSGNDDPSPRISVGTPDGVQGKDHSLLKGGQLDEAARVQGQVADLIAIHQGRHRS